LVEHTRLLDGYLLDKVDGVGVEEIGGLSFKLDLAKHRTGLPQLLGEATRVNAEQTRHAVLLQPAPQALDGVPMGVGFGVVAHDEPFDVHLV
jgi:hypothetical protein